MTSMNLAALLAEYQRVGPQATLTVSQAMINMAAAASVESSGQTLEVPASIKKGKKSIQREVPKAPSFDEAHSVALSLVAEQRLFNLRFSPVKALFDTTRDVERLFLSIRPKEVARIPGLVFRREQFEANWALAHYTSDVEAFEADIGRVTEAQLAELAKEFRTALADYRNPARFSQNTLNRYLGAKKSILASIGPDGRPHDPDYNYVAALMARIQEDAQYELPIPIGMDSIPAAC